MRPFSMRFTIRRIMAAVAAIALVLGIGGMVNRWNVYRRIAEYHRIAAELASAAQKVAIWKATVDECFNEKNGAFRHALLADWIGRMGSFHSKLRWKYSQAKWRPWRFPDPDPPPPPRPPPQGGRHVNAQASDYPPPQGSDFLGFVYLTLAKAKIQFKPV